MSSAEITKSKFAKRLFWSLQMLFILSLVTTASQDRACAQSAGAAKKSATSTQKQPVATGSNAAERSANAAEQSTTGTQPANTTEALTHASKEAAGEKSHADTDASAEEKSKENAEGGENDAFKYSPSVRWFGAKTGMDVHTAYWVFTALNFVIVVGLIFWGLTAWWPGYVRGRNERISRALEEARRTSEDAKRRLGDIESRLSKLDSEIASMRTQADQEGRAEEQRMKQSAEEEKRRILAAAEQEIASASANARRDLKSFAAEMAVTLAQGRIAGSLDGNTDKDLVREFATRLGNDGNGGRA